MRFISLLLPILLLGLSGCTYEWYTAQPIKDDTNIALQQDEIIIFGKVLFIQDGESAIPYGFRTKPIWFLWGNMTSSQTSSEEIEVRSRISLGARKDGIFIYVIPSGRYEIDTISPLFRSPPFSPALEFTALTPGVAYYLGDLEIDYDTTAFLGDIEHLNYLEVVDRYDEVCGQISIMLGDKFAVPTQKALLTRIWGQVPRLGMD